MIEKYRKISIQLGFLGLLLLLVSTVEADSAKQKRDQDILRLMKVTGIDDFLVQMPDLVEAGMFMWVQSQKGVTKDQYEKIKQPISKFFSQAYFKHQLTQYFKTKYDGLRFKKIARLFRTPLSTKMILLENELRTEQGKASLQEYPDYLDKTPPSKLRTALVVKLDKASRSSEMILKTQLHILKNVLLVGSGLANDESSLSINQINAILDTVSAQIRQQVVELVMVSFLFTYRDASDIDLQNYVELYNNESLQWFFNLYLEGLDSTFSDIPSELSRLIRP